MNTGRRVRSLRYRSESQKCVRFLRRTGIHVQLTSVPLLNLARYLARSQRTSHNRQSGRRGAGNSSAGRPVRAIHLLRCFMTSRSYSWYNNLNPKIWVSADGNRRTIAVSVCLAYNSQRTRSEHSLRSSPSVCQARYNTLIGGYLPHRDNNR